VSRQRKSEAAPAPDKEADFVPFPGADAQAPDLTAAVLPEKAPANVVPEPRPGAVGREVDTGVVGIRRVDY
jgi:hypothetical protein